MQVPQIEVSARGRDGTELLRTVLPPGEYILGRDPACELPVAADRVSPAHARLTINFDHALIEDLGSEHGTHVSGQRVTDATRLWPNQKIEIGSATIELHRIKSLPPPDVSLAPSTAAVRQMLPEELLREKKYEIGGVVAQGGMGAILDAKEAAIERTVAMKVMLDGSSPDDITRFVAEAKVTGQLEHPNIVPVHELNVDENDQVFYTMKFVRGITLRKALEALAESDAAMEKKYPLPTLLTVFQKVCDAIAFAHAKQVIHRDLKPENIMVGDFGEVLVMDWGLAKTLGGRRFVAAPASSASVGADEAAPSSTEDPTAASRTLAGSIMGTPQYMSPEQARGEVETLDARTDIYALGAILYHILALRPSVTGDDARAVVEKVARGEIEPLIPTASDRKLAPRERRFATADDPAAAGGGPSAGAEAGSARADSRRRLENRRSLSIPDSLAAVVRQAMVFAREQRYASVEELQADIEAYQNGFATSAEHAGLGKQLVLLIKRHRGIFSTAAAAWFIITALGVWFVMKITASEHKATHNAEIAQTNEQRAVANEQRAVASEQEAVAEKENVRRALAKSALALAEAAYREADGPAMQSALDTVPADLRDANWSYLLEQSDTSIARIAHGATYFRGAAPHPKLPSVFAVADHRQVIVMDVRSGNVLLQFPIDLGETSAATTFWLAFSPDGERIAVGKIGFKKGGGIAIHNARDGTKIAAWESSSVTKLEFSPDGKYLLQLSDMPGSSQNLWDAVTGKRIWTYDIGTAYRANGGVMPDGREVMMLGKSGGIVFLKMEDGTELRRIEMDAGNVSAVAIRPDGLAAIWGDHRGGLHCVDVRSGSLLFSNRVDRSAIIRTAFTADGEQCVSVAETRDGRQSIIVSDARTGSVLQSVLGGSGAALALAIHPLSGELLVVGPNNRVWDIGGPVAEWKMPLNQGGSALAGAAFLNSDDRFFGPTKTRRAALLDLQGATVWEPPNVGYQAPTISRKGDVVAFAKQGRSASQVAAFRHESGKFTALGSSDIPGNILAVHLDSTGERMAVAASGNKKQLVILETKTCSQLVPLDQSKLTSVNELLWLIGDARLVGIAVANKPRGVAKSEERIIVWDAASGQQVRSVVFPTALDCLVVAPDGKRFAAAGADKLVHVFDTETLEERQNFRAHDGPITALAWHPSRPIVATGSADLTIKVWNLDTGRRLETLRGPTAAPRVLNFSPSGQRLACASEDRMVRIWEPKPLNNAVLDAPAADGWEDLLAKLKADEVKANGNGWTLSGGVLVSPEKTRSVVPLPGSFARSSYTLRTTVRRLKAGKSHFAVILPVGDQQVAFILDGDAPSGFAAGLSMVDNKSVLETTSAAHGQQIQDSEPHDLEITVRLSARTAQVTATLDDRPLYEWSGAVTSLQISANWPAVPQPTLHLGASSADWVVSALQVKRLP